MEQLSFHLAETWCETNEECLKNRPQGPLSRRGRAHLLELLLCGKGRGSRREGRRSRRNEALGDGRHGQAHQIPGIFSQCIIFKVQLPIGLHSSCMQYQPKGRWNI